MNHVSSNPYDLESSLIGVQNAFQESMDEMDRVNRKKRERELKLEDAILQTSENTKGISLLNTQLDNVREKMDENQRQNAIRDANNEKGSRTAFWLSVISILIAFVSMIVAIVK